MMWYSHGDLGWAGWTLMAGSMVVFWGLLIWGISLLVRVDGGRNASAAPQRSPEQVLAHRFAAGELDSEGYEGAMDVLAAHNRGAGAESQR